MAQPAVTDVVLPCRKTGQHTFRSRYSVFASSGFLPWFGTLMSAAGPNARRQTSRMDLTAAMMIVAIGAGAHEVMELLVGQARAAGR